MTTKTENAPETNAFSTLGNALESAAEKFEEGSAVARQSAKQAAKVTRNLFTVARVSPRDSAVHTLLI
jgi:hypothetical protein